MSTRLRVSASWLSLAAAQYYRGIYRVMHLGWVELDFECSNIWLILLGPTGIWQNRLSSWARWWKIQFKFNPTQVHGQIGHPVEISFSDRSLSRISTDCKTHHFAWLMSHKPQSSPQNARLFLITHFSSLHEVTVLMVFCDCLWMIGLSISSDLIG